MPYEVAYKNNGFIISQSGVITIGEIHEVNNFIHSHEKFDSHKYQIINLLNADFSEILNDSSKEPAAMDWASSLTRKKVNIALVVRNSDGVDYCQGYIDYSRSMGSPWSFKIFPDMNDALKWLGL